MDSSLNQLLQSASAEGRFHSEGVFTIDDKVAVRKLAALQLPRPSAWLLKIVQSAVIGGASSLKIRQLRDRTVLEWDPCRPMDTEAVTASLTVAKPESTAEGEMSFGLRALGGEQERDFVLCCRNGGAEHTLTGQKGAVTRQLGKANDESPSCWLAVAHGNLPRTQLLIDENREVAFACQASPIKILCDQIRIDTLASYGWAARGKHIPLAVLWEGRTEDDVFSWLGLPLGLNTGQKGFGSDRFLDKQTFQVEGPETRECSSLARLSYVYDWCEKQESILGLPGESFVHWIKSGVIIVTDVLDMEPTSVRLDLFLNAEGLGTDLSGFRLRHSNKIEQRINAGLRQLNSRIDSTIQAVLEHKDLVYQASSLGREGTFILVHGLAMGIATKGLTLPFHYFALRQHFDRVKSSRVMIREDCVHGLEVLKQRIDRLTLKERATRNRERRKA